MRRLLEKKHLLFFVMVFSLILMSVNPAYANDLELDTSSGYERTDRQLPSESRERNQLPSESRESNQLPSEISEGLDRTDERTLNRNEDTAAAVSDLFKSASLDAAAIEEANYRLESVARILNLAVAIVLGLTVLLLTAVTVIDLLYMAVPFFRDRLDGGGVGGNLSNTQHNGRGMGMQGGMARDGRYGGGMGMAGRGVTQNQQNHGGGLSSIGRMVSDEAIASVQETEASKQRALAGDGSVKNTLRIYMMKRSYTLVLFGVCAVLLTTTVFTDLGVKIGMWIMRMVMGIGG